MAGWLGRRRAALQEADALLTDLGIDRTHRIDVFDAIAQLDVWLTFVPLQGLLGACVPRGGGGIMITTERQRPVQRYTAAHEVGHWILDHERPWFDGEAEILGTVGAERERLAQLFAAYFLMPPDLIHATAEMHAVVPGQPIEARQAYLMARDMGVSYEAAVRQLTELNFISAGDRDRLVRIAPLRAKRDLAHGIRPVLGYADVWPVDERWSGGHLEVAVGDEIAVALPESRSTGYRWMTRAQLAARDRSVAHPAPGPLASDVPERVDQQKPASEPAGAPMVAREVAGAMDVGERLTADPTEEGPAPLAIVSDHYAPGWRDRTAREARSIRRQMAEGVGNCDERPGIGATGRRWLMVHARQEGTWAFELWYAPAHQPGGRAVAEFNIGATVHPPPTVVHRRELAAIGTWVDVSGPPAEA